MFVENNIWVISIALVSLLGITFFRKQMMIILLSFEIGGLSIFIVLYMFMKVYNQYLTSALYMLIIVVCEASLGLSLLVVMTRTGGNDNLVNVGI
uniref:NADH-ubiquinone oxidoreductase chain 4L n=1 Tax=Celleporella hyalina TaxID=60593 RepID=I6Q1Q7_9BILA|nr:NADH dehydrogenase subunit 4L [Celleporella hyalina]